MKKISLLAFVCAMFMGTSVASAQEVTYVEDPAQGYLFNSMKDNWFVSAEAGVGMVMSSYDKVQDFGKRLGLKGQLSVGKWFTPVLGLRASGEFNQMIHSTVNGLGVRPWNKVIEGNIRPAKFNNVGIALDVMFNATNLVCGYKADRCYNLIPYVGFGHYWTFMHAKDEYNMPTGDWKYAGGTGDCRMYSGRLGILNTIAVSKKVDVNVDLRGELIQRQGFDGPNTRGFAGYVSLLVGATYKFGKSEWTAPVVPVCPEIKYTDAYVDDLRAKLEAANKNIAALKKQLEECKNKKVEPIVEEKAPEAPLATIYFPIGVSKLVGVQKNVVDAVAEVMKNENSNYVLTGWADNYTGSDKVNTRLRKERVATVKNTLVKDGVEEERMDAQINDGNLVNFGAKSASLSRAVTVERAK